MSQINQMGFRERLAQTRGKADNSLSGSFTVPPATNDNNADNSEVIESCEFYGVVRINSNIYNLELILANGTRIAPAYSYITNRTFHPTDGISFCEAGKKFVITGRNLETLWDMFISHRLKYIRANVGNDLTNENQLYVGKIEFEEN